MENKIKACLIICWFGPLPKYFPVWLQTVKYNKEFDFLIFTDQLRPSNCKVPGNVIFKNLTLNEFTDRAKKTLHEKCSVNKPYRICDYRPMFGLIFAKELINYDFWGYCDLDLVFGNLSKFVNMDTLKRYEAIFNGGHFSLIKNNSRMNNLFKQKGSAFNYKTVIKHDAIFAFDEITGIQQIARQNNIDAIYLLPYVDADVKYSQLRSVLDKVNPVNQCFYWENGDLFRVRLNNKVPEYTEIAYIHLQKRPILLKSPLNKMDKSFWITPNGYEVKKYLGQPNVKDIKTRNPYIGKLSMNKERKKYFVKKIYQILRRNPFQIYVRFVQARNGINRNQGTLSKIIWKEY